MNKREQQWLEKYELAKKYYEYHGNLEVPRWFKIVNGFEYDKNGIKLGIWIYSQKKAYKNQGRYIRSVKRIKMLKKIGMCFDTINLKKEWIKKYSLAKTYYKYHKNLEIPIRYRTINGYEYDKDGLFLGKWILNQRQAYKGKGNCKNNAEQIKLLNKIGMVWDCDVEIIKQRKINLNNPSYIYAIINLTNNKKYIGQSINPEKRFYDHWKYGQTKIDKTICEYGLSNFKLEILEKTTLEFINEREQYWINKFNTTDPEYGYNVQKGGTPLVRFK